MTDNKSTEVIVLDLKRYDELIKTEEKYLQYKRFLFENSLNTKFKNALIMLEHKNYYEIVSEMEEK